MPGGPVSIDSREAPIRGGLTSEARLRTQGETNALTIRQAIAKDQVPGSPLERFNRALEAARPPKKDRARSVIDQNIGIDIDQTTGKKVLSSEEAKRERSVNKDLTLARELGDKGFDGLSTAQRKDAVRLAGTILDLSPEIAAIVPTDPVERQAFIEDLLHEKGFTALVQEGYGRLTADSARLVDEVTPAKDQLEQAKRVEAQRQAERNRINTELTTASERLERFEPGHADDVELTRLTKALPELTDRLRDYDEQSELVSGELGRLRLQRSRAISRGEDTSSIDVAITAQGQERSRITRERAAVNDDIAKKDQLEKDKTSLPKSVEDLTGKLGETEAALTKATREKLAFQATAEGLKEERGEQEQAYADEVGDIIPEAMAKYIRQQLQAAETAQRAILQEISDKSTDRAMQAVANQALKRYEKTRTPTFRNRSTTETDTLMVNNDRARLVDAARGPGAVVRDMLERDLAVDVAAGKMTQAQADQIITLKMQDQAFLDNAVPIVVESVLRQVLKTGTVTEAEADVIVNSSWGKGMLQKASQESSSPPVNAEIEELKAAGVVSVDEMDAKQRKGLLLKILFGALATGAVIGTITK